MGGGVSSFIFGGGEEFPLVWVELAAWELANRESKHFLSKFGKRRKTRDGSGTKTNLTKNNSPLLIQEGGDKRGEGKGSVWGDGNPDCPK